jgi:hypothetical protein
MYMEERLHIVTTENQEERDHISSGYCALVPMITPLVIVNRIRDNGSGTAQYQTGKARAGRRAARDFSSLYILLESSLFSSFLSLALDSSL